VSGLSIHIFSQGYLTLFYNDIDKFFWNVDLLEYRFIADKLLHPFVTAGDILDGIIGFVGTDLNSAPDLSVDLKDYDNFLFRGDLLILGRP
jgi:hypothetical protein